MSIAIFFDMDGVVADFVRGTLKVHGREDVPISEVPWGLEEKLGIAPPDFWAPMGFEFWRDLLPLDDGMQLLRYAEGIAGPENVFLLTSPCDTDGCYDGKKEWVKRHLPHMRRRMYTGNDKRGPAGPDKILVDDRGENAEQWFGAGGHSVLIPRPWNTLNVFTDNDGRFNVETLRKTIDIVYGRAGGIKDDPQGDSR